MDFNTSKRDNILTDYSGELQRVAIVMALGVPADIYLIDEPSAYLDSERMKILCKMKHNRC